MHERLAPISLPFPASPYAGVRMLIDWHSVFVPSMGIAEVLLRGSLMYLSLFAILRFVGRRQAGHFGPADLLVIVLIADAAQNALKQTLKSSMPGPNRPR